MNGLVASFERSLPLLLAVSMAVIVAAIGYYADGFPLYWETSIRNDALIWIGACLLLALLLRIGAGRQALPLFCSILALYLAVGVGLEESATALLFFSACYLYGRLLLGCVFPGDASAVSGISRPLLVGLAIQLTFFGVLIHVPLNFRGSYLAIQLAPLLVLGIGGRLPEALRLAGAALKTRIEALATIPYWYCIALLVVLGMIARYAFLPTLTSDDNAGHLRMWTELTANQQFSFDVVSQIWEVSPFAVNLMHGIVSLIAGEDARGALNLALLALLLRQLWAILAHFGSAAPDRLLLVVLFASTPLAGVLLITLQTELLLALLAISGVRLVLEAPASWYNASTLTLACIAALCCAVKLPGAVLGLLLLTALLIHHWPIRLAELARHSALSKLLFATTIAALAVLALNSYVTAWRITGNPVFPLYNGIFESPYFDASNFLDDRWVTGFGFSSYWNIFFNTHEHYESDDFVAGFHYLFVLPLALPLLWLRLPKRSALTLLVPLFGFGLLMFSMTQYWRYLFPVLPLASVVIGFLLLDGRTAASRYLLTVRVTLGACLLLNLWFYPGASWLFAVPPGESDTDAERELLAWLYVPAKAMSRYVSDTAPGSQVLYHPESPFGAVLVGDPIYVNWYAPTYLQQAAGIHDEAGVRSFMEERGIDFVIWNVDKPGKPGEAQWLMKQYLSRYSEPVMQAADHVLFRLQQTEPAYRQVFSISDLQVGSAPLALGRIATGGADVARFNTSFACSNADGYLVTELTWDDGLVVTRQIPCSEEQLQFSEALVVPNGVVSANLQIHMQDAESARVASLTLEIN